MAAPGFAGRGHLTPRPRRAEFSGRVYRFHRPRSPVLTKWPRPKYAVKHLTRGFLVKRKSIAKRVRAKIQELKQALMRQRHAPIPEQGAWLRGVVRGYYNYHAIPGNMPALETFQTEMVRAWLHALRRRSQRHRMSWKRFNKLDKYWIPRPKILHPHPNQRFYAKHPR